MSKLAHIIVGVGFGDEGKGLVTDFFCTHSRNPIVIRFNGGQQAGHTVFLKTGKKHIFSNFGSGTLRGISTYWTKYCTFCPGFFLEELKLLKNVPTFFLDSSCPVTTHYDILYNRIVETFRGNKKHGSCGLGFGATLTRHKELSVKLTTADLMNQEICIKKLVTIREYYKRKIQHETNFLFSAFNHDREDIEFVKCIIDFNTLVSKGNVIFANENDIFGVKAKWKTYIFEGAQGILLDVNFGQQPYVTKSSTTSKNALTILKRNFSSDSIEINVVYVTRAYSTRHGEGPFRAANPPLKLKNTSHETNVLNEYQGKFRIGYLNIDLINYAIKCDQKYSKKLPKHLFITCLDQITHTKIPVYIHNRKHRIPYNRIHTFIDCNFESIYYSFNKIVL